MVAFGVQPEFTCKLAVAGEEHGTDDADDVAGVNFVGALKVGSDGLYRAPVPPWCHLGKVFSLLLTGVSRGGCPPVSSRS